MLVSRTEALERENSRLENVNQEYARVIESIEVDSRYAEIRDLLGDGQDVDMVSDAVDYTDLHDSHVGSQIADGDTETVDENVFAIED